MQRWRVSFSRGEEVKFISHLDLMRLWERAFRRAGVPLAYSQGFSPHPKLSLAAPLALGITSQAELMDIFLTRPVSERYLVGALSQQLPRGIDIRDARPMAPLSPSLPSQVRSAEYRVETLCDGSSQDVEASLASLLVAESLPWQHARDTGVRHYDLRALVLNLWLMDKEGSRCLLGMRLRADNSGSGRPEQVVAALGFPVPPLSIHRTELILAPRETGAPRGERAAREYPGRETVAGPGRRP
jgi:radical SAM-linked protein